MKINHIALYVNDLESMRRFYETYFRARTNTLYHNPKTGLRTYFLSFPQGDCRLELMLRPDLKQHDKTLSATGYTHLACGVGSRERVDELTETLAKDGYTVVSAPRTTGDGYYESVVLDPEGNAIEIVE
ncbi:MAG: VOC family protein [Bacteroidales bacterium]|jgi:lactoylglutathione lyase|nr:VOC family protein [Bacteroidales bacterium]